MGKVAPARAPAAKVPADLLSIARRTPVLTNSTRYGREQCELPSWPSG